MKGITRIHQDYYTVVRYLDSSIDVEVDLLMYDAGEAIIVSGGFSLWWSRAPWSSSCETVESERVEK